MLYLQPHGLGYCCSLLIGSPRSVTDKLQRVLSAVVSIITNTKKYESGLSQILHHDLQWLDVTERSERIQFQVAATIYQYIHLYFANRQHEQTREKKSTVNKES